METFYLYLYTGCLYQTLISVYSFHEPKWATEKMPICVEFFKQLASTTSVSWIPNSSASCDHTLANNPWWTMQTAKTWCYIGMCVHNKGIVHINVYFESFTHTEYHQNALFWPCLPKIDLRRIILPMPHCLFHTFN